MPSEAACDIEALLKAFLQSFDKIENMPGSYIIRVHPDVKQVQHSHHKFIIEPRAKIIATLW